MSRNLSLLARQAVYAPQTDEAFLVLLTLAHPDLSAPVRVSSDAVDTVSRGAVFVAFPFGIVLPDDDERRSPRARLVIDNVDRTIVQTIRGLVTPPVLTIEVVRAAAPDIVEAVFTDFRLANVVYDARVVEADLCVEDFTMEPFPAACFTPSLFPGLF